MKPAPPVGESRFYYEVELTHTYDTKRQHAVTRIAQFDDEDKCDAFLEKEWRTIGHLIEKVTVKEVEVRTVDQFVQDHP